METMRLTAAEETEVFRRYRMDSVSNTYLRDIKENKMSKLSTWSTNIRGMDLKEHQQNRGGNSAA